MKQLIITIAALLLLPLTVTAQYEEDTENGVVSLNGKEGFTIATKKGFICCRRDDYFRRERDKGTFDSH